jgi:hypothetical protein
LGFLRVSREPGELREGEARDAPAAHVGHHPLRLWMLHDGFPRDAFQVVDLADLPAAGVSVTLGPHLMVLANDGDARGTRRATRSRRGGSMRTQRKILPLGRMVATPGALHALAQAGENALLYLARPGYA